MLTEPRPVYGFPTVPPDQAIVLVNADGYAFVLLAADKPEGGWDPELRAWMRNAPASTVARSREALNLV